MTVPLCYSAGTCLCSGPGSSVGITTDYGLDSPGLNPGGPVQTGPGAHPASCKMRTGSFPGVKCGQGVLLTTYPLLVPRSWKSRAIPLPTLCATRTCNGITLPFFYLSVYVSGLLTVSSQMIADSAPSSDWEVLRWHLCREGVYLLFTGSCSLMPGQYSSPEKG